MTPDPLQQIGWEIAKAMMLDEGIPFNGYEVYEDGRFAVFRLYFMVGDKRMQVVTTITPDMPLKVITQKLRFYAEGAMQ